jgi:hypothetical protein
MRGNNKMAGPKSSIAKRILDRLRAFTKKLERGEPVKARRFRLPAFEDDPLPVEAAQQLIEMTEDSSFPTHEGKDLPKADPQTIQLMLAKNVADHWAKNPQV